MGCAGELEEGDPFYVDISRATLDMDDAGSTPFARALSAFEPEEPQGAYEFDDLADPLQHALAWELLRSCNRHLGFVMRELRANGKGVKLARGPGVEAWSPEDGVPPPKLCSGGAAWTVPTHGSLSFAVECKSLASTPFELSSKSGAMSPGIQGKSASSHAYRLTARRTFADFSQARPPSRKRSLSYPVPSRLRRYAPHWRSSPRARCANSCQSFCSASRNACTLAKKSRTFHYLRRVNTARPVRTRVSARA